MNLFVRAGLERQLAAAQQTKTKVEDALANAGPLALLHQFKAGDVPYFKAGFVWRRIKEHHGMTQKISEMVVGGWGCQLGIFSVVLGVFFYSVM